jgi:hypothetical protein
MSSRALHLSRIVFRTYAGRRLLSLFVIACTGCQSPFVPPAGTTLTSLTVSPRSVGSGVGSVQGAVTLSSAPTSAVSIALSSDNAAAAVPASVTLVSGATSSTFGIDTTAVSATTTVTITATFGGSSRSTTLTVTALAASFTVRALVPSQRRLPSDANPVVVLPTGAEDACPIVNQRLACVFDGSASTALTPIRFYRWTYFIGPRTRSEETNSPVFQPTEGGTCTFLAGLPSTTTGDLQFIPMRVHLQVGDAIGAFSATLPNPNVRIFPQGQCFLDF